MPLRIYKNKKTGKILETLKKKHPGEDWEEVITAPNKKLMVNAGKGKSKIKDLEPILKERARNHSRDVDLDETISINKVNGLESTVRQNFLNEKGERRTKLDDI